LPRERPSLERFVADLGRKAFEAACWRGVGLVADSIAPGVGGRVVEGLRFASKVAGAFDSLADGRGIAVAVPVAVDAKTGFSLEVEATVGRHAQVRLDVGLDPWAPPKPGEPSVSGVPKAAAYELALDELVRVNTVVAPSAVVAPDSGKVDAAALGQLVRSRSGVRAGTDVIAWVDPDRRLGLIAVVPFDGQPYCPLLLDCGRDESDGIFEVSVAVGPGLRRSLLLERLPVASTTRFDVAADVVASERPTAAAEAVGARAAEATQVPAGERATDPARPPKVPASDPLTTPAEAIETPAGERPTAAGEAAEDDDESSEWSAIYAAWRRRQRDYFGPDKTTRVSEWRESVERQHAYEIGLIRGDELRAAFAVVKNGLSACVAEITTARRCTGFFDFAPAVLGFVLIGLAKQLDEPERPAELVDALFDAAGLVLGGRSVVVAPPE
jgi:hypothetical protein